MTAENLLAALDRKLITLTSNDYHIFKVRGNWMFAPLDGGIRSVWVDLFYTDKVDNKLKLNIPLNKFKIVLL